MPVMDGMTTTRLLRERGITVPIVGVTGNALDEDIRSFVEAGANEILVSATADTSRAGAGPESSTHYVRGNLIDLLSPRCAHWFFHSDEARVDRSAGARSARLHPRRQLRLAFAPPPECVAPVAQLSSVTGSDRHARDAGRLAHIRRDRRAHHHLNTALRIPTRPVLWISGLFSHHSRHLSITCRCFLFHS